MKNQLALSLLTILIIFVACSKEEVLPAMECIPGSSCNDSNPNTLDDRYDQNCQCTGTEFQSLDLGNEIQTNVAGRIYDDSGNPLEGVKIFMGKKFTYTDVNGVFILSNGKGHEKLALIRAEMPGYFPGSRSFVPTEGINKVAIRLLQLQDAGTISGSEGGIVNQEDVSIRFDPNSFTRNGILHEGAVQVYINFIDPSTQNYQEEMPGILLGNQGGEGYFLTSYGMVAVELRDDGGNDIELDPDYPAHISFPIPESQQFSAPPVIDLWSYNEDLGYWIDEGEAIRDGGVYHANVSHFSFWNFDVPSNFVLLEGQIIMNGTGVDGALVTINSSSFGSAFTYTNYGGHFSGYVPSGQSLALSIENPCNGASIKIIDQTLGVFLSDVILDPITISPPDTYHVFGNLLNCEGETLTSGYVIAENQAHYTVNGEFSFVTCNTTGTIIPFNTSSGWEKGEQIEWELVEASTDLGALTVCGQILEEGFIHDIQGNVYPTVLIGEQEWMAENLKTGLYRNGDPITTDLTQEEWSNAPGGACTTYDNEPDNVDLYGRLYNRYCINDSRGICPSGWHIPSIEEYGELTDYILSFTNNVAEALKSVSPLWGESDTVSTNLTGFSALPGGIVNHAGVFSGKNEKGVWGTSNYAKLTIQNVFPHYYGDFGGSNWTGYSVRCVKD